MVRKIGGVRPSYISVMDENPHNERFWQAYEEYSDAIFRHCYFRVYDRERAKELVQECYLKTWEYLIKGHEIENLRAFLYRTATNLVIDESRRRQTLSLEEAIENGFQPVAVATDPTVQAEVVGALRTLERLDPKHREAVRLRYLDGLGPQEIAAVLGESENNVSVRIHRGLTKLRQHLGLVTR